MAVSIEISDISLLSQNIANNTSRVFVALVVKWTGGSWNHMPGQVYGWLKIDGTKFDFELEKLNPNKTTSGEQTAISVTWDVPHDSDGKKTLEVSASMATGLSSGTVTTSAYKVLDTIYSTSSPSVSASSVDMGGRVTIYTNRESSGLTHDLAYSFAGSGYTTIATGVGASYTWTVPDLASAIPNSVSGTVTIRCITKSGGTSVGTKTVTMTLKVPDSVVPTISTVATSEATSGLAARFGAYIRYKSQIKATITAAGSKGSTIKSYSTTLGGRTYTGASFTSQVLQSSGSLSLVTTVTDSRGRTAKKTTTITVLDYSPPAINNLQIDRVNAAGESDGEGTYVAIRYKYSVTSLSNKNTASMVLDYKRSTDTEWTELLTGTALSADTTVKPTSPTFSTDYQFDFRMRVTDWFGTVVSYTAPLSSGAVILDFSADGLGLGVFKVAERDGIEFGASAKGAVLGLWEATAEIPENGDFNEYLQPGVYNVPRNDTMVTINNRPCDRAGTLRVSSGIGTKKISGAYAYLVQEFHSYHNMEPIFRRHLISDDTGAFEPGPWKAVTFRGQAVLWSGAMYMTAGHTAELSAPISKQDNGIVLVFSTYQNGAAIDANFNHFFVPKKFVEIMDGYGSAFQMNTVNFSSIAAKYLYIHDTRIVGNDNNNLSGTAAGITFNNALYVLRYVLGV